MTLRLMLVGLVTGMGLELPSERDLSCWADSGRAWVHARLADLPSFGVEVVQTDDVCGEPEPEPAVKPAATESAPTAADLAFEAASGRVSADFASDQAASLASARVAADSDATFAEAAAPAAFGRPAGEEIATVPAPAPTVEVAAAEPAVPPSADDETCGGVAFEDEAPSRADRLSSAVRITREAVQAWSDLIRESADESGPAR